MSSIHGLEVYEAMETKLAEGEYQYIASTGALYRLYKNGKVERAGRTTKKGYTQISIQVRGRARLVSLSRFVFFLSHGRLPLEGMTVDHIDRDRGNNRLDNIRELDGAGQVRNRGRRSDNSSGYAGVNLTAEGNWMARTNRNGVRVYLGVFDTSVGAHEAIRRYEEKEEKLRIGVDLSEPTP